VQHATVLTARVCKPSVQPNLTDDIWLHGFGESTIIGHINNGIVNIMPPQGQLLTKGQLHVLVSYIWGLSNKS
jgi:cytochrome c oxidase cbb3-type subunit 3